MWLGLMWARYLAPFLLSLMPVVAACGQPGESSWARGAPAALAGGLAGAAAWLVHAAVATRCGRPGNASRAWHACLAAGAAIVLVWAAAVASWGRLGESVRGLARLRCGRASGLGCAGSGSGGLGLRGDAWGSPAGGQTGTVTAASLHSSRSAGVSSAHPGRWRRSSCLGEPYESDILAALAGRCMVCAAWSCVPRLPSHPLVRPCCGVGGAVWCQGLGRRAAAAAPGVTG